MVVGTSGTDMSKATVDADGALCLAWDIVV